MTAAMSPEPFLAQLRLEVLNAERNAEPSPSQPNFSQHLAESILQVHYFCRSATILRHQKLDFKSQKKMSFGNKSTQTLADVTANAL